MRSDRRFLLHALSAVLLLTSLACRGNPANGSTTVGVPPGSPTAERLAARQVGEGRAFPSLVRDFDEVLTALEVRCTETRTTSPCVADIAINVVATSKKGRQDITELEVLRALEASIHEGADMKIDCMAAALSVFAQ